MATRQRSSREPVQRRPTYGAATRLARIVHGLFERPFGWSFADVALELGISERTLLRYLEACRRELVDAAGRPLLEVELRGERRMLRLASRARPTEAGAYAAVSFFFTWSMIRFLDGTVLDQGMDVLWKRMLDALPELARSRLRDVERKFFALPFTPKDYRKHDDTIAALIPALIDQHRLRIDYGGLLGEGRVHEIEPYTLLGYRGGLYLLGRSDLRRRVIWLAVERMRAVTTVCGEDGKPVVFAYPPSFRPERYTDGLFGVFEGPETEVEILIENPETEAYLRQRTVHPSQKFTRRADGRTLMSMKVRGTVELANWIMGMSPWVEVLRPAELRAEIAGRLATAVRRYAAGGVEKRGVSRETTVGARAKTARPRSVRPAARAERP